MRMMRVELLAALIILAGVPALAQGGLTGDMVREVMALTGEGVRRVPSLRWLRTARCRMRADLAGRMKRWASRRRKTPHSGSDQFQRRLWRSPH